MQYYQMYLVLFGRRTIPAGIFAGERARGGVWVGTLYQMPAIDRQPVQGMLIYELREDRKKGTAASLMYFDADDGKRKDFGFGSGEIGQAPPLDTFFDRIAEDGLPGWFVAALVYIISKFSGFRPTPPTPLQTLSRSRRPKPGEMDSISHVVLTASGSY